ncbi:MAG: hypothetical protein K5753_07355, partial [Clostridia bacterium]|nr:hypothetical protein [Clostridia bacterium]
MLVFSTTFSSGVTAYASEPVQIYNFYSVSEFTAYARAYAAGDKNPEDVIYLTYNEGNELTDDQYVSLGTSDRPFAGTIYIPSVGIDTFRLFNCPLFDYVSTKARIMYNGTTTNASVKIIREAANEIPAEGVLTSGAAFANHVVKGESAAFWNVQLLPYEGEGSSASNYEGLIGSIANEASVTVSLTNTSSLPVVRAGDAGLICGTLGEDASLTVGTSGSGNAVTVTSTGNNAGGLVGTMLSGAELTLSSANNTRVSEVTGSKYAGGLVGSAINPVVTLGTGLASYAISSSVTGGSGAGGVFGYCKTQAASETFAANKYDLANGLAVSSTTCAGGFFGLLDSECEDLIFDGCATSGKSFAFALTSTSARGGVAGRYKTNALTNSFEISNVDFSVTAAGSGGQSAGIIGQIIDGPAYLSLHDIEVTQRGNALSGGLIGNLGNGGSFADVRDVVITGGFDAGLIGNMPQGVLRIQGETDFSSYNQTSANAGLIVRDRGRALIYALGNGSDAGWTVKRNVNNDIDDVRGWGEVLRADGTILRESDLVTVDGTAHTVTINAAAPAIGTITQFALTALNIQLNTTTASGALRFTSGDANKSASLLSGTIEFIADITLAGTGLTGFTRDDGANDVFTGTLDGNLHTVTLTTGEKYGLQGNGSALASNSTQGAIHRHFYNGLFAKIGGGASINDLAIDGDIKIQQSESGMFAGALAAYATGAVSISALTVTVELAYRTTTDCLITFGGAIGTAVGSNVAVSASDSNVHPIVSDSTESRIGGSSFGRIGGFLGSMMLGSTDSPSQSVMIENSLIGLTYTESPNTSRASVFGGVIAVIGNSTYVKDRRTVVLDTVSLSVTATGTASNGIFGGLFGTNWLSCDVTVDGVTVNATISATGGVTPFGGLVQTATGRWDISDITLTSASYTLPNNGSSFGFVANKTHTAEPLTLNGNTIYPESALYLDVNDTSSHYDIGALTFTGSPTFSVYDELVASSVAFGSNVTANGNSVVSVTTSGNVIDTTGTAYNTYLNKTAYGRSSGVVNAGTRYYYNLAYARANLSIAKYKFLVWSVKEYAHASLAAWFAAEASFTGNLDMTGVSYYPINVSGTVSFTSVTIKLDNILTESSVHFAYRYNNGSLQSSTMRSTRANTNQHYLMHTSVFLNAVGTIVVNNGTLQGNVPALSDTSCGFLVAGVLGGSDAIKAKCNFSSLTLDGVYISNGNGHFVDTAYAPLIINKVGKNTTIDWAGAEQTSAYAAYEASGYFAASSLIGDVGDGAARAIYLTFGGLALDSRTSHISIDNFDTVYGTGRSVFSRATILNSFLYFAESSGSYNFEMDEDRTGISTATHSVTYGKEITSSLENVNKQKKYYGSEYYVHPTLYQSTTEYDFSLSFHPYVYVPYNLGEYKHEISVNVTFSSVIAGCGKYGDPYVIDDNDKLPILSEIIAGTDVGNTVQLYLPDDLTSYDYTGTSYTKYLYNFGITSFEPSDGGSQQANANVRRYLAGAYYVITKDVTLPASYTALGTTSSEEYAFRGVLIGRGNPIVTNKSRNPLIYSSNGCVVKDLTVEVDVDYNSSDVIELAAPMGSDVYSYSGGIQSYGAVIQQIMGGDTFIDNVQVTFTNVTFSVTALNSSYYPTLTPVGGYVGVLVNGGLIFRNMTGSNVGLTASAYDKVAHNGYLYVNAIIGRVIAGYAFNENEVYHATETTVTLKNGEKNYTITDLVLPSADSDKLNVTYASGNTYDIAVPNGQAWYVLGAIVNSGAASASYHVSNVNAYQALTDYWSAYRAQTTARAGATYDAVGVAGFSFDEDYTDYAVFDSYTADGAKIPYIIRAYTAKSGSAYLARCISENSAKTRITVTSDCDVAQGFRGVGSIYIDSPYVSLNMMRLIGGNRTITLHMRYVEYDHKSVSAYIATPATAGFGLFNYLRFSSPSETNSLNGLVLSGSVYYDMYTVEGYQSRYLSANYSGDNYDDVANIRNETIDNVNRPTILSAGGLLGFVNAAYYIKNVTFNGLSVEGAKSAGGLIGLAYSNNNNDVAHLKFDGNTTNTGYVNVVAGLHAGGLFGQIYKRKTEIIGADGGTDVIVKNIEMKTDVPNENNMDYYGDIYNGVGGIIGNYYNLNQGNDTETIHGTRTKQTRRLYISNIRVKKGTEPAFVKVRNDSSTAMMANYAGGFIGSCHNVILHIYDCSLVGVNVRANTVGGLVGRLTQNYFMTVRNVTIDGSDKTASLIGTRFAGGAVGWLTGRDGYYFGCNGLKVKDYEIISTYTENDICASGGIVAFAEGDNVALNNQYSFVCDINNATVTGCLIKTNYANGSNYCGTGGFFGASNCGRIPENQNNGNYKKTMNNESFKYKFSGYDLLLENTTLVHLDGGVVDDSTSSTNRKIGCIVGNNAVSSPLKFVGVT